MKKLSTRSTDAISIADVILNGLKTGKLRQASVELVLLGLPNMPEILHSREDLLRRESAKNRPASVMSIS